MCIFLITLLLLYKTLIYNKTFTYSLVNFAKLFSLFILSFCSLRLSLSSLYKFTAKMKASILYPFLKKKKKLRSYLFELIRFFSSRISFSGFRQRQKLKASFRIVFWVLSISIFKASIFCINGIAHE